MGHPLYMPYSNFGPNFAIYKYNKEKWVYIKIRYEAAVKQSLMRSEEPAMNARTACVFAFAFAGALLIHPHDSRETQ